MRQLSDGDARASAPAPQGDRALRDRVVNAGGGGGGGGGAHGASEVLHAVHHHHPHPQQQQQQESGLGLNLDKTEVRAVMKPLQAESQGERLAELQVLDSKASKAVFTQ